MDCILIAEVQQMKWALLHSEWKYFKNTKKFSIIMTNIYINVWMYAADPHREVCLTMETVYIYYEFGIRELFFLTQSQLLYSIKYQHVSNGSKKKFN